MKKLEIRNRNKILIIGCMFLVMISCIFLAVNANKTVVADAILSDVQYNSQYVLGETVEISDAQITVDGVSKPAQRIVISPSGVVYTTSKLELNEAGEYVVRYSAEFSGKTVKREKRFVVHNDLYQTTSKVDSAVYDEETDSVLAKLTNGSFQYNKVIDISENTIDDSLIDVFVVAEETGKPDFLFLYIKLTDINDPSNFICVRIANEEMQYPTMMNNQTYVYLKYMAYLQGMIGQDQYGVGKEGNKLYQGGKHGTSTYFSFLNYGYYGDNSAFAEDKCVAPVDNSLSLRLDYQTKQLYVLNSYKYTSGPKLVCDFDDPAYFSETWDGFSEGKCLLSVYASSLITTNANIGIEAIQGEKLRNKQFVDDIAPEIVIDYGDYTEENYPLGTLNSEYQVFDYKIHEDYGVKEQSVKVYYNYYSDEKVSVSISNGKFKTNKKGVYTIEYSATDYAGNKSVETVKVFIDEEKSPLEISVDGEIGNQFAGYEVRLPIPQVQADQVYGNVKILVEAKHGNTTVNVKDYKFVPMEVGEWTVIYYASNYGGQKGECRKTFTVSKDVNAVFIDDVSNQIPQYMISGNSYELPTLLAYNFEDDSYTKTPANIKYKTNGGWQEAVNGKITPVVSNDGDSVSIVYYYGETQSEEIRVPVIKVKNGNEIDMKKLFVVSGSEVSSSAGLDYIQYGSANDFSLQYVNQLIAEGLIVKFKIADLNAEEVVIMLSDIYDGEQNAVMTFKATSDGVNCTVGGLSKLVTTGLETSITITYSMRTLNVNGNDFVVRNNTDGTRFTGFDSEIVYLTAQVVGVTQMSSVIFQKVAKQPLGDYNLDSLSPSLTINGEMEYYSDINTIGIIKSAIAYDAIDGKVDVYVSVRVNGKYLTSIDGVKLDGTAKANVDYQVRLEEFGTYYIKYIAYDNAYPSDQSFCNSQPIQTSIMVLDTVAPEVTVNGKIVSSVEVGKIYHFNEVSVQDNVTTDTFVKGVMIISNDGIITPVENSYYKFTVKGNYIVRYYVIDEAGNIGYTDCYVTVK